MADKRKAQQEEASRLARRRRLATAMLMGDTNSPIAIDREFRTPIYDDRYLPKEAYASVTPDNQSPSLSRMSIAKELQSASSIEDYLNRVAPNIRHEKIHVLQNLDNTPFTAADVAMRENLSGNALSRYQNLLSQYPVKEIQAYLGSNTIDANEDLKKSSIQFDEVHPELDRFFTNKTFEQRRQDKLGDLRKQLINSLPLGLQNIIGGWSK